jgi:hypothetical protein
METYGSWRGKWRSLIHETSSHDLSTVSPAVGIASSYKYPSRHTWNILEQVIETYSEYAIDYQMRPTRWLLIA